MRTSLKRPPLKRLIQSKCNYIHATCEPKDSRLRADDDISVLQDVRTEGLHIAQRRNGYAKRLRDVGMRGGVCEVV